MANNRLVIDGLDELREQLRNLPAHLASEADAIVSDHADDAAAQIREAYPQGPSGNLRAGVSVQRASATSSRFGTIRVVKSQAKHAWLYENGSQARHTDIGANRGSMPARATFIPIMQRERREMYQDLGRLLEREGLTVTGI